MPCKIEAIFVSHFKTIVVVKETKIANNEYKKRKRKIYIKSYFKNNIVLNNLTIQSYNQNWRNAEIVIGTEIIIGMEMIIFNKLYIN